MHINEAKKYLGHNVAVTFVDRHGEMKTERTHVHDISYVPMYGGYIVGDMDDFWLDKITSISAVE